MKTWFQRLLSNGSTCTAYAAELGAVVESAVAAAGVSLNTASVPLLSRAGLALVTLGCQIVVMDYIGIIN